MPLNTPITLQQLPPLDGGTTPTTLLTDADGNYLAILNSTHPDFPRIAMDLLEAANTNTSTIPESPSEGPPA